METCKGGMEKMSSKDGDFKDKLLGLAILGFFSYLVVTTIFIVFNNVVLK